jgi:nitrite reductase/ring-hydroxylating ferredoxin subunit
MPRYVVGTVESLPPGSVKIMKVGRHPQGIGVFNVDGDYYALKNVCPHQGARLCEGPVTGTTKPTTLGRDEAPGLAWSRDGEIVRCPWHRWEVDIRTGRTVYPSKLRVATYPVFTGKERVETYPVIVEDDVVILEV